MSVKVVYGSGPTTLTFKRGPVNFRPYFDGRVHDNLSTSGAARERVVEHLDLLISFDTPHLVIDDDMAAWGTFMVFALAGGGFKFYPSDGLGDYYNCVLEDPKWEPERNAPKKYGATVTVRVLQDSQAPASPDVILRRFYGLTS
jgi:hypothetical protein